MDSGLLFPGCPADPDRSGGRCGLPAKVRCRFMVLAGACTRMTVTSRAMPALLLPAAGAARQPQEVER